MTLEERGREARPRPRSSSNRGKPAAAASRVTIPATRFLRSHKRFIRP